MHYILNNKDSTYTVYDSNDNNIFCVHSLKNAMTLKYILDNRNIEMIQQLVDYILREDRKQYEGSSDIDNENA